MTLQNVFYIVSIIYEVLFIIMVAAIVVLLFFIKNKIADIHDTVEEKIDLITQKATKPFDIATHVGSSIADALVTTAKKMTQKNKRSISARA